MQGRGTFFEYWGMENLVSFTGGPSNNERSMMTEQQQDTVWIIINLVDRQGEMRHLRGVLRAKVAHHWGV